MEDQLPLLALLKLAMEDEDDILTILDLLSPIILHANDLTAVPQIYHKSFSDFITQRCTIHQIRIDPSAHHGILATNCAILMEHGLKKNILAITNPLLPNAVIPNFVTQKAAAFSRELKYACLHWSSHICKSNATETGHNVIAFEKFVSTSLLWWIEGLILLSDVSVAQTSLEQLHVWAVGVLLAIYCHLAI